MSTWDDCDTVSEENVPVENASSEWNNALLRLQSGLVVIESKDLALRNLQREALGAWFYIIILWIGAVVPKFLWYIFQLNLDISYQKPSSITNGAAMVQNLQGINTTRKFKKKHYRIIEKTLPKCKKTLPLY